MEWHELRRIIDAVACGIAGGLFAGFFLYLKNRMKLELDLRKWRVLVPASFIGGFLVFCVLSLKTFIVEKYDFRGKWDAYQFRKTMIEAEAFEPIQESIVKPLSESETLPIEESDAENEEVCCGGSEEEREAFEAEINEAWDNPDQADPALVELLPSPEIIKEAEAFLRGEDHFDHFDHFEHSDDSDQIDEIEHSEHSDDFDDSEHSDDFEENDLPLAPRDEPEIDWDQTRIEMLAGAEASHGEIGKALLAETMLEADHFMENMSEADALAIAKRAQDMWEKQAHKIPEPLISGTNAAIWRKTFEMLAAIERSEINEEMREFEEEEARRDREFWESMEAKGHSSISEEEYMRDYLGMSEEAISETLRRRQERVLHNSNDATFGN